MAHAGRNLVITLALAALLVSHSFGQEPAPNCPSCGPEPHGPFLSSFHEGPPPCAPYEDANGPLLKGSPLLDWPAYAPPGVFGAVELDTVGPHVKNRLTGPVTVNGATDTIQIGGADLNWTVSPRFEFGYRLAQGAGEILVAYQFLDTSGSGVLPGFDPAGGTGNLHSRLDLHVIDLDYGGREPTLAFGPNWDWKWKVGVRLASVYFDSQAASPLLEQRAANHFFGAGPHAGLDMGYCFPGTGLELFGRVETALTVGQVTQSFEEVFTPGTPAAVGGASRVHHTQPVPFLGLQAGVTWSPVENSPFRLTAGYTFGSWWSVGEIDPDSRGDVTVQGIFVRGEWRY
jgi:hypothetical protein